MSYDYDLFVIGGGSGGVRAARLAGQLGKRVAIAEESRMGGTCVIRGCVPKKLMVYASSYAQNFRDSFAFGWSHTRPVFDWAKFRAAKDQELNRLEGLYRNNLLRSNVKIFNSRATLADPHTIVLATGEKIRAQYILVATGGRVFIPPEIGGNNYCISSDDIFDMDKLPESVVVAGGGYIAIEFANILHAFGVKTTLVYRGDLILRKFDRDLRSSLSNIMAAKGINIVYNAVIKNVEKGDSLEVSLSNGEILRADQVVLALGRLPNTAGLGLSAASVDQGPSGEIVVDQYLKTSQPNIYAVGDVTNRIALTPVAIHEAHCFIETVFHQRETAPDYDLVATAVFSQPEIGTVGLSEEDAAQKYERLKVFRTEFRPMRNTLSGNPEKTIMKLIVDEPSDVVVGAHILGPDAGELIQVLAISLKARATKAIFDQTMAVHPTAAEELVTMYQPTYRYENGRKLVF